MMSKTFDLAQFMRDIEEGKGSVGRYEVPKAKPQVFQECDRFVSSHPEMFDGLSTADARNRCLYLHAIGKINVKK